MSYLVRGPSGVYIPPPLGSLDYSQLNAATTAALTGYRNRLINSGVKVNQRGASTSTSGTYGSDRWRLDFNTTFTNKTIMGVSAADLSFSDYGQGYFYFGNNGTVPSIAAGDFCYMLQQIEGINIGDLYFGTALASPVSLSFKVRCNGLANFPFSVVIRNGDSTRSYTKLITTGAAGSDLRVKLKIPGDVTGTWKTDNTTGLIVGFTAASGSTYTAAADGVWSAGNFIASPGQGNLYSVASTSLVFADVQLEKGGIITPFEIRPFGLELMLCQRYFETGNEQFAYFGPMPTGGTTAYGECLFKQPKRASPTITMANFTYWSSGSPVGFTPGANTINTNRFGFSGTGLTNWNGWPGDGTWQANAEM